MKVNFLNLDRMHQALKSEIMEGISGCIDRNSFILGKEVEEFEAEFAKYIGTKYCVGVSSGLAALELALRSLGIGVGDEVITVANSFIATALAITKVGAMPVFIDCDETFEINHFDIEKYITNRTKAIIPVHLYGNPSSIFMIKLIAEKRNLYVIEDVCQSHGAVINCEKCGSIGDIGCFSYYSGKNLGGMMDGGSITTNDERVCKFIKMYRNYGQSEKYNHEILGGNDRLDSIQAKILSIKLKHLDDWNSRRRDIAKLYRMSLDELGEKVQFQRIMMRTIPVYHLFEIVLEDEATRNKLAAYLGKNDIQTGLHYPKPIHLQKAYEFLGYKEGDFPVAEKLSKTMLSLPICPYMRNEEVLYVCDKIKEFFK